MKKSGKRICDIHFTIILPTRPQLIKKTPQRASNVWPGINRASFQSLYGFNIYACGQQQLYNWYEPAMQTPPMAHENESFNLHFISGNISKCAGCGNKYVKPPVPPYDVCIQHKEWRSFSSGGVQQSKFAPTYYHVNEACVKRNWPTLSPEQLFITPDVFSRLTSTHTEYLYLHKFMS